MRIPEVREQIEAIAKDARVPADLSIKLRALSSELKRRPTRAKAPVKSRPMSPSLAAAIRAYKAANPSTPQADIAAVFNVNPGRVSEAIRGKRK